MNQLFGGVRLLTGGFGRGGAAFEPVIFFVRDFGKGRFAIALVGAEKIVASPHGQAHEPMLKWRVTPKTAQLLKRFDPDLLNDVLHFAFQPGIAPGGGKDARRIFLDQWLEARGVALKGGRDQLRVGAFHWVDYGRRFFADKGKSHRLWKRWLGCRTETHFTADRVAAVRATRRHPAVADWPGDWGAGLPRPAPWLAPVGD